MFQLVGESQAQATADAQRVMSIETALAKPARTRVELRDPNRNYNKMTSAELAQLAPHFNWPRFFTGEGRADITTINVQNPDFVKAEDSFVATMPLEDWKAYLHWKILDTAAQSLSSAFVNEDFRYGSKQTGAKPQHQRDT